MIPFRRSLILLAVITVFIGAGSNFHTLAQRQKIASLSPEVADDLAPSEMRAIIEYFIADRGSLQRSFFVNNSSARRDRFRKFYADALERMQKLNFDGMSQEGKVDYILFRSHLEHELRQLDLEAKQQAEIEPLIPFGKTIIDFEESRRSMAPIDSAKAAATLNDLRKQLDLTRIRIEAGLRPGDN